MGKRQILVPVLVLLLLLTAAPLMLHPVSADVTVFTEDFEGDFPGNNWVVGDGDAASGLDYWGRTYYKVHGGFWSAWCVEEGQEGDAPRYDLYMSAYMRRTVDLSAYSSATLSYYYWLDTEGSSEDLTVMYLSGETWNYVDSHGGNSDGWQYSSVSIPITATSVGFFFYSDGANANYEGAYVDDVVLTASAPTPSPTPTPTPASTPTPTQNPQTTEAFPLVYIAIAAVAFAIPIGIIIIVLRKRKRNHILPPSSPA